MKEQSCSVHVNTKGNADPGRPGGAGRRRAAAGLRVAGPQGREQPVGHGLGAGRQQADPAELDRRRGRRRTSGTRSSARPRTRSRTAPSPIPPRSAARWPRMTSSRTSSSRPPTSRRAERSVTSKLTGDQRAISIPLDAARPDAVPAGGRPRRHPGRLQRDPDRPQRSTAEQRRPGAAGGEGDRPGRQGAGGARTSSRRTTSHHQRQRRRPGHRAAGLGHRVRHRQRHGVPGGRAADRRESTKPSLVTLETLLLGVKPIKVYHSFGGQWMTRRSGHWWCSTPRSGGTGGPALPMDDVEVVAMVDGFADVDEHSSAPGPTCWSSPATTQRTVVALIADARAQRPDRPVRRALQRERRTASSAACSRPAPTTSSSCPQPPESVRFLIEKAIARRQRARPAIPARDDRACSARRAAPARR